uniref:Cleft lip and palate transmembrane protein 1 n=1 Tax=Globisporangium ultimum (strain ATCC 200006 / CBS 805.95 / DAOM BR144) TaxID=431595 RepID=K3X6Q4_GLOUD
MAAANVNVPQATGANAEPPPQTLWDRLFPVVRMILFWYLIQSVTGGGGPLTRIKDAMNPPTADPVGDAVTPTGGISSAPDALKLQQHEQKNSAKGIAPQPLKSFKNAFQVGDMLNLRVYVSPDERFEFNSEFEQEQLLWWIKDIRYDPKGNPENEDGVWTKSLNVTVDEYLLNNGSLYAHVFITKEGFSPNPEDSAYDRMASLNSTIELTTFRPRVKATKKRNLLESIKEEEEQEQAVAAEATALEGEDNTYVSMWKPAFAINVVHDANVYSANLKPPPFLATGMHVDHDAQLYLPVLYMNEFWILEEHLLPVNNSVTALPLELSFYPLHLYKFALYTQMEQNFKNQQAAGTSTKKDTDKMKEMFIETNPYLLGLTVCVSLLHSLFDFLAFKNDVSFWKNQKSLAGLSLRTIVLNTFFQLVIFLYLMDNDTSWMILASSFISLLIEAWKIKKAIKISRDENNKIVISGADSYNDSPTAEHDRVAVAHLSYVLYPLIVGHAFYTLAYGVHKGWYSWVVSSLTSFVYAFGFIMMTPQLYINYKLKSVAHLPWRAMVYKSLNTFIDDLFAFVIKMPWMHRLSCFRDDLIFFIYLYQKWIYPVDATRTNEFGQSGAEPEEAPSTPELTNGEHADSVAAAVNKTEDVGGGDSTEYLMSKRSKMLQQPQEAN